MKKDHEFWRKQVVTGLPVIGNRPNTVGMEQLYLQFKVRFCQELSNTMKEHYGIDNE